MFVEYTSIGYSKPQFYSVCAALRFIIREKLGIASVSVRTNPELRPSRLFNSIWGYVKKSMITILRAYMMYKPLKCFTFLMLPPMALGIGYILRYFWFVFNGTATGHVQSLILACMLLIIGFLTFMIGLMADTLAANRRLLEDTQYHVRRTEYDALYLQQKVEKEAVRTYMVVGETSQREDERSSSAI